jgi:putative phage-type endonuclease
MGRGITENAMRGMSELGDKKQMIIEDAFEQGSPEWHRARLGNPGASNFSKILTNTGTPSKQANDYLYQLAGEFVSGVVEETHQSIHMENGLARETEARALFEMIQEVSVRQVGICYKDEEKKYHASPDGLIGEDSGLELKCPMLKTHVKYLLNGKMPAEYYAQVQGNIFGCEREYWWFMSYFEGIKPFIIRVERDKEFLKKLEAELDKFCYALAATIKELKAK